MPASSSKIGAPPVAQSASSGLSKKNYRPQAAVKLLTLPQDVQDKPSSGTSIDINVSSDSRALLAHGICSTRLEILAMSDFLPLYNAGENTLAGNLFDVRTAKRNIDLSSVRKLVQDLKSNNPDAYQNVLDIYSGNLQSTKVELELLKSAYLMKQYGSKAFSYISHLQNYLVPALSGLSAQSIYSENLAFEKNEAILAKEASTLFAQLLADASIFSRIGFPKIIGSKKRDLISGQINMDLGAANTPTVSAAYYSTRVGRELAASLKISEVNSYTGEEKELHSKFKSIVGNEFFSATAVPDFSVFEKIYGVDSWFDESASLDISLKGKSSIPLTNLYEIDSLVGKIDIPDAGLLLLEDGIRTYNSKTYQPAVNLVNTAFKPKTPLNFGEYSTYARAFYGSCIDSASIHSQLYFPRFKAKSTSATSFAAGQRLSPVSVFQEVLKQLNNGLATKLNTALYATKLTSDQEMVDYAICIAHVFMRDRPDDAAKILSAFVADYKSGFLNTARTVSSVGSAAALAGITPTTGSSILGLTNTSNLYRAKSLFRSWLTSKEQLSVTKQIKFTSSAAAKGASQNFDPETNITVESDMRNFVTMFTSFDTYAVLFEEIVLFEVIEFGMKVINGLLSRFSIIESLVPEDSKWPYTGDSEVSLSSENAPAPYSNLTYRTWSSNFEANLWIPTLEVFVSKIERGTLGKTWMSGMPTEKIFAGIFKVHSSIMFSNFKMLKAKYYKVTENPAGAVLDYHYGFLAVDKNEIAGTVSKSTSKANDYSTYFTLAPSVINAFLSSSPTTYQNISLGTQDKRTLLLIESLKNTIISLYEDDSSLRGLISIIQVFGQRTKTFSENMIDTFTGGNDDENALYTLITQLASKGNPGLDILENLNPEQLLLKKISLGRQSGNPRYGYIPANAVVSNQEKMSIQVMASNKSIRAPEGLNLRAITVGVPVGMLRNLEISDKFSIGVRLSDIEFSDLVFKPKFYNFNAKLFIGPDGFDTVKDFGSFESVVNQTSFFYSNFEVKEVPSTSPKLVKSDSTIRATPQQSDYDVFSNTAASFLLELYYKLLTGVDLNEDTFPSVSDKIGVNLNKYAGNVSAALASISADLAPAGSSRAKFYSSAADITSESNAKRAAKVEGFTEVDAEFLNSVRNAYATRLLSAEDMRDTILKAKLFDRVIHLLIDPDEFELATAADGTDKPFTQDPVIDKYLLKGILEKKEVNGVTTIKLAPRKISEGRMAFCKLICSIEPSSTNGSLVVPR